MNKKYIPERGDIVYITLDPTLGHEQKGRRPALVLSQSIYNQMSGLCVAVPITSKTKKYLFEISLGEKHMIKGYVLCDQIKNMSWKERKAEFVEKVDNSVLLDVCGKASTLIN